MSFYDDASLMLLASGGAQKDGKVYSVKPTDGAGDFTFTRGSNLSATRVNASQLIEKGRENLLTQSNTFSSTNWSGGSVSRTGGQTGYDGSNDAWLLTSSRNYTGLVQNVSPSGVHTFSAYLKDNNILKVQLRIDGSSFGLIDIDLTAGVITGQAGTAIVDKGIESVGNGWYRAYIVVNNSVSSVRIIFNDVSGTSFYIQDAQLEIGLAATEVIETGATTAQAGILEDTPRFDYSGGATCPSLLLEPSRTNLVTQSEYIDSWSKAGSLTISTNNDTSPEGIQNASLILPNAVSGTFGVINSIYKSASSLTYTLSGFAKAKDYNFLILRIDSGAASGVKGAFDLSDGTISTAFSTNGTGFTFIDADIKAYANNWYKYEVSFTTDSLTLFRSIFYVSNVTGNGFSVPSYAANGTDGILFWGAQAEAAPYATSYIPNHSGGTITRVDETCTGAGDAATLNDSEGVFYAELSTNTDGTDKTLSINNSIAGGSNSRLWMGYSTIGKRVYTLGYVNNSLQFVFSKLMTDESVFVKIACKYALNDVSFFVNGEKVGTDTSALEFIGLNSLDFNIGTGGGGAGGAAFYGKAKQVLYFPTALSDADCITLTTL